MNERPDEDLVVASREGDRSAFALLVDRYRNLIVRVAYSGIGNFDRSEDVAQQTFITAWQRRLDLAEPSNIAAWLCGITRNHVRNERRRASREAAVVNDVQPQADVTTPEQNLIALEESQLLWTVLEAIPETYREPMVLYYREGATAADVAIALGISENLVRQRLSRGRKLLSEKVAQHVEGVLSKVKTSNEFVGSVMLALPASATSKAATGTLGIGLMKVIFGLGYILGPLIGIAGAFIGSKRSLDNATSETERRALWRLFAVQMVLVIALVAIPIGMQMWMPKTSTRTLAQWLTVGICSALLSVAMVRGTRQIAMVKRLHGTPDERPSFEDQDHSAPAVRHAGLNLVIAISGSMAWMFIVAILQHDWAGLAITIAFLVGLLSYFVPKTAKAPLRREQTQFTWQALATAVIGMIAITAYRWPLWAEFLLHSFTLKY